MAIPRSFGNDTNDSPITPNNKRNRTRRNILIALLIIPILFAVIYALFQDKGILWLFEVKTDFPEVDLKDDLAIILAPLTALALAIERIIETLFDLIEQSVSNMAKLIGETKDAVNWVEEEYSNASKEVKRAIENLGKLRGDAQSAAPAPEEDIKKAENKLKSAEDRLAKAGERLSNMSSDPIYIQMKRAISIMVGLFLGFMVAILSDQGIFAYLQQGVPRVVDLFVTGFIIGAGSGPMHSLVGILQGFKDAIGNLGSGKLDSIQKQLDDLTNKDDE